MFMMDERCFPNPFPDLEEGASYSIPDSLTSIISASIRDLLVYVSSPSSYAALLGVSTASVLPPDDGTVYTGSGGLALLHLKLGNPARAEQLASTALQSVSRSRLTFLCGAPGPLSIQVVAQHQVGGSGAGLAPLLARAQEVAELPSSVPDELLYGRAGYLYTLLWLRSELGEAAVPSGLVRRVVEAILRSGQALARSTKSRSPLMFAWHERCYLGAAHGLAGILAVLLQARDHLTPAELQELIRPSLQQLLATQLDSGNFPSSKGKAGKDRLVQWCHGAPGLVPVLLLASEVWPGEEAWLEAARRAGRVTWQRGLLRKGGGLCHGVAGSGYTFLHLYRVTGDQVWLYRAAKFGEWLTELARPGQSVPDRPLSLFEGLAGVVYFLHDLQNPETAKFPCLMV